MKVSIWASAILFLLIASCGTSFGQLVRMASGSDPASIQTFVDQYRSDFGTLNPSTIGSVGSGRAINWDGVPDNFAVP